MAPRNQKQEQKQEQEQRIRLLLLGQMNSGKTEVAHRLLNSKRQDYMSTNGVRNYTMDKITDLPSPASRIPCSLTEIGGNDDMQQIWHYYYVSVCIHKEVV